VTGKKKVNNNREEKVKIMSGGTDLQVAGRLQVAEKIFVCEALYQGTSGPKELI